MQRQSPSRSDSHVWEVIYVKSLGRVWRAVYVLPVVVWPVFITASLCAVRGVSHVVVPTWMICVFVVAIAGWLAVPIQFEVLALSGVPCVAATRIRLPWVMVRQRSMPYESVEIKKALINLVLDSVKICNISVLCVQGQRKESICGSWLRALFWIDDAAMMRMYTGLCARLSPS